ncbi:MAG: DUF2062 domain-containing protein [Gammaproteobacteria bacterium]|nr:DUF2062 domain-containing protein [Gammaproteobacteria bacterium]
MAKNLIKKYLPHPRTITSSRWLKLLGPRLHEPSLWHLNRRSFAGAMAVGMFCAFLPIPFQMLLAAIAAVAFRVNILIAVPLVWISNPITVAPIFYFCYYVGALIMGTEIHDFIIELDFDWLLSELLYTWQPLLLGSLVVATIASLVSFMLAQFFWRYHLWTRIKIRRRRRRKVKSRST